MSIADKLQTIAENVQKVYEAGKAAGGGSSGEGGFDTFWDAYQEKGNRYHWNNAFSNQGWNDTTYGMLKYPITSIRYAGNMFLAARITDTLFPLDFSSVSAQPSGVFDACATVKTIRTLTVSESNTFTNWFRNCTALTNIEFSGVIGQNGLNLQWSNSLSHDSLLSIINCLQDKTGDTSGTVWKVTVGGENYAKLTEEDIANITAKGWIFE